MIYTCPMHPQVNGTEQGIALSHTDHHAMAVIVIES